MGRLGGKGVNEGTGGNLTAASVVYAGLLPAADLLVSSPDLLTGLHLMMLIPRDLLVYRCTAPLEVVRIRLVTALGSSRRVNDLSLTVIEVIKCRTFPGKI